MYDRKTWVILAVCAALFVANSYYMSKKTAEQKAAQEARQKANPAPAPAPSPTAPAPENKLTVEAALPPAEKQQFVLKNDKVSFTLTNIGGGIEFAEFADEFAVGSKTEHVRANRFGPAPIACLAGPGESLENIAYTYKPDLSVEGKTAVFIALHPSGLIAKKTFSLVASDKPGAPYLLDLTLQLENKTTVPIGLGQWSLFLGEATPLYQKEWAQQTCFFWHVGSSINSNDASKFKGGWFGSAKETLASPEGEKLDFAGVTNQFFATALRPADSYATSVWGKKEQITPPGFKEPVTSIRAGLRLPSIQLNPAEIRTFSYHIFVGPKHNPMLRKMESYWGNGWGDAMQYGWFWFVSNPLNRLLNIYHSLFASFATKWAWGLAIILLTITVRLFIWPLHAKSTRTMKRMSKLQPEMAKLREKYAADPAKLNTEMMGLYRKYGVNPLGGCLPMFIQIPIFFGFYRMLQYAVELRGESFLWVHDLSQPDTLYTAHLPFALPFLGTELPINILPIVMAITSFLQIKMTPSAGDKAQQRIIALMPFMFFFFCYSFASALALYWTTQNIFSIGQTWLMNKIPEPELKAKPAKNGGKSWIQRLAERQAELQKQQQNRSKGGMRDVTPDKDKKKRTPRTGG